MRGLCISLLVASGALFSTSALADGCFVFKWNKAIDINEPTQKAIIVHDAGREDLLLQVKYEGPLEEFGWLIPVPSLPKVEKGSMEPFYELSQLTQRQFGGGTKGLATLGAANDSSGESVKVIETKTVGAYEVSVLAAKDSDGLARWLRAYDYSLPEGESDIVEDYIRRGWYFIAAKIELNKGVALKTASTTSPGDSDTPTKAHKALQKKLASGELHPLLISFDTPKCVFPLKISAMNGRPSEVSLYVLSQEPLVNKFIFDKAREKLDQHHADWEEQRPQRERTREDSTYRLRALGIGRYLDSFYTTNRPPTIPAHLRDYTREDLIAIANEGEPLMSEFLGDYFYASPGELLQSMHLKSGQIPKCAKNIPRLKGKDWYLTKQVWTFAPTEMDDLELEPAIPIIAAVVRRPAGAVAAQLLAQLGPAGSASFALALKSTNPTERLNAARNLAWARDQAVAETLLSLLNDEVPEIRVHAIRATENNWDRQFADFLIPLFRDPDRYVRREASGPLIHHEPPRRTPIYLALLNDPDPNVRMHSLAVVTSINRDKVPQEVFEAALRLLRDSSEDVQNSALHALWRMYREEIPRADLLRLLDSARSDIYMMALNILQRGAPGPREEGGLTSAEAAPLITKPVTMARLRGLRILQHNADTEAVELILPLLSDTNSIVRNRAFAVLRNISGQNISDNDPAKWEAWWAANKSTFSPRSSSR